MNSTTIAVGLESYRIIVRNLTDFCVRYGPVVEQGIELYQETKKLAKQLGDFIKSEGFVAFKEDIKQGFKNIFAEICSFGKNTLTKVRQFLDEIPPADAPSLQMTALRNVFTPIAAHILSITHI